jgi:hypothetical protein
VFALTSLGMIPAEHVQRTVDRQPQQFLAHSAARRARAGDGPARAPGTYRLGRTAAFIGPDGGA